MHITRGIFERQCKRRFGTANPERMLEEYYQYVVRSGLDPPPDVREELGLRRNLPCSDETICGGIGPDWFFDRFGISRTLMPDGRILCIGGEYEDFYDPDFCIYNDLIVLRPALGQVQVTLDSGQVEIYGYPESVFPPTDFHSATLVDDKLYLIGRLGYSDARRENETPVYVLDHSNYEIEPVLTTGPCPGWIYDHHAAYDAGRHAITVRGGKLHQANATQQTLNFAAHQLHLADMRWERLALRETHRRFVIEKKIRWRGVARQLLGSNYDLFWPPEEACRPTNVPHAPLLENCLTAEGLGTQVHQIDVQGVRVHFDPSFNELRVRFEGELSAEIINQVLSDVAGNLRSTSGCKWTIREVTGQDARRYSADIYWGS